MGDRGQAFLFKTSDGAEPPRYMTVAGLRLHSLAIRGELVALTNKDADAWRELLSGAGVRTVSISASGIFLGSAAEAAIRANALAGVVADYELSFDDGSKLNGGFLVQRLDYIGDFNGERNYSIQLESSGPVVSS